MLKGDFKQMNAKYVRGQSLVGYGISLAVGVGIPIPMLNEEMAEFSEKFDDAMSIGSR